MATGKSGTLTPEDFKKLEGFSTTYGEKTLALKVAKFCTKVSGDLTHEYPKTVIGKAYADTAKKITAVLGSSSTAIPGSVFMDLSSMVRKYGPELVVTKLAKIAKKGNKASVATSLKGIFPAS